MTTAGGTADRARRRRRVLLLGAMNAAVPQLGEADRCPHCRALAAITPHRTLRWVCAVCGGARVPGIDGAALGDATMRALVQARHARAVEIGWMLAAIVTALAGTTLLAVAALAALASRLAAGILASFAAALAALAWTSARRSTASGRASREALDEAWLAAIAIAASGRDVTPAALARAMMLPEADAERLLGVLSAQSRARVEVTDDAQLRYRIEPIDAASPGAPDEDAAAPAALDEDAATVRKEAR